MTKKHFQLIAENLNLQLHRCSSPAERQAGFVSEVAAFNCLEALAISLANRFQMDFPRFNRSKFLAVALA